MCNFLGFYLPRRGAKSVEQTRVAERVKLSRGKTVEQRTGKRSGKEKKMYRNRDEDFNLQHGVLFLIQRNVAHLMQR